MRGSVKRNEMMLAHRIDRDIVHDDHLLMALVELLDEQLFWVLCKARHNLVVHAGHACGRLE